MTKAISLENLQEFKTKCDQTYAPIGGGGGTTVVANPTLSGSEAELTGLEVAGTKYKVGGSTYTLNIPYNIFQDETIKSFDGKDIEAEIPDVETIFLVHADAYTPLILRKCAPQYYSCNFFSWGEAMYLITLYRDETTINLSIASFNPFLLT